MKTSDRIKTAALSQFNSLGWVNVTLRDVAALLGISYGNATYHFPNKEQLLEALYADYQQELLFLMRDTGSQRPLLLQLLEAPAFMFDLSLRYRFFFADFLELQRQYPAFMVRVDEANARRMLFWQQQLELLQTQGFIRPDADAGTLHFLMDVSGMVRTFFFLRLPAGTETTGALAEAYQDQVNRVLWPYLSPKGLMVAREAGFFREAGSAADTGNPQPDDRF